MTNSRTDELQHFAERLQATVPGVPEHALALIAKMMSVLKPDYEKRGFDDPIDEWDKVVKRVADANRQLEGWLKKDPRTTVDMALRADTSQHTDLSTHLKQWLSQNPSLRGRGKRKFASEWHYAARRLNHKIRSLDVEITKTDRIKLIHEALKLIGFAPGADETIAASLEPAREARKKVRQRQTRR
jgi:hypothetical protein